MINSNTDMVSPSECVTSEERFFGFVEAYTSGESGRQHFDARFEDEVISFMDGLTFNERVQFRSYFLSIASKFSEGAPSRCCYNKASS